MNIKAIIHPVEEGGYWAEVPALPDCITKGSQNWHFEILDQSSPII